MNKQWWHEAVAYQIYPKSFQDSNGDGIGDLRGIAARLPYLQALGVNTLWLCPMFASPMVDNGYDISDYRAVHPQFGTMDDLDELLAQAKRRNMHVLLDLVLNHTSDRHPWFESAVSDPESPYRDFYIIRRGQNGLPPNNWRSMFGGSAWERIGDSNDYYLHAFAVQQPDLNWENPLTRRQLYEIIHWWMDRGVSGFRIDAICIIKKDLSFASLPPDGPDGMANPGELWQICPGIEAFLAEMRDEVFAPRGAFTVGECDGVKPEQLADFIGDNGFFTTIFDFSYTNIDLTEGKWYVPSGFTRRQLRDAIFAGQRAVCRSGHGAPYLENHDQNRSPDKYLQPQERCYESKTMLGMLWFFLQGVPFIYQGQELGMENHPWSSLEEFDDVAMPSQYHAALRDGLSPEQALAAIAHRARDNARTPMLWDDCENAGFTTGQPWLPVHPDYPAINAAAQMADDKSVWSFYRDMVKCRLVDAALFYDGDFVPRFEECEHIFAYERGNGASRVLVVCNFHDGVTEVRLPSGMLLLGNARTNGALQAGPYRLAPFEAMLIRLSNQ